MILTFSDSQKPVSNHSDKHRVKYAEIARWEFLIYNLGTLGTLGTWVHRYFPLTSFHN